MTNALQSKALAALADPTRQQVLDILRSGPKPVGEIAARLPVSRPAVSQHLKVLGEAGLVSVRAEGTRRLYAVRPEGLVPLRRWLDGFWDDVLTRFAAEIDQPEPPHD
ncbi:MAG: metalloregulator ArsR/SmtB family transcription factor [Pararhodobacter sp.]